nr:putative ribonuclease H-like domain-containing protein [Tanacetum cinerariifolium]
MVNALVYVSMRSGVQVLWLAGKIVLATLHLWSFRLLGTDSVSPILLPVFTAVTQSTMKSPRPVKPVVIKAHSLVKRPFNQRIGTKNSNFNKKVTTVKQALKDKGVIDSGCTRHMTGNISFLLNFEEISGGYVAFRGNPKGVSHKCMTRRTLFFSKDTECVVLSSNFKLPDENHVLLRVPRENNMYNVELKNVVPLGDLTCLFAKATLDESNLWHKRLGHINFKTMNKLVKDPLGKFDGKADEGFLVGYSVNSKAFRVFNSRTRIVQETLHINFLENKPNVAGLGTKWLFDIDTLTMFMNYQPVVAGNQHNDNADPHNTDDDVVDAAFDVKENENDVHVYANGSDKSDNKKHNEKAKRYDKGKSLIDSLTRARDFRAEFEEFSISSSNRVNAVSAPVNAAGTNPTNNTNSFNTACSSVNAVSPNFRIAKKSSFVDLSKYPDDPDMPELEDIVYSDDEEDGHTQEEGIDYDEVFARIEAIRGICCQPLGFEDPNYPDKVYKAVKALYGLHQAPRAWYETLANYLLENGFQKRKIDQTLFIKKQKGDILLVQVYVDDIIFGSTNKELCKAFEKLMKDKFQMNVKSASTLIKTKKPLLKDPDGEDMDVHICSNYAGASLDRKSTTGGCQFLGCRLISCQCKKHTVVATSSTEAEYVVAASCYAQVLWIQNQLLDYGVECLSNEEIFKELARMGYGKPPPKLTIYKAFFSTQWKFLIHTIVQCLSAKKTTWNEFSCSMASVVICLAKGRKFNFFKYIFDSMVRNVDSPSKFLMYPRFLQVLLDHQVDDMTTHNTIYTSVALTQKAKEDVEIPIAPAPPSTTTPTPHDTPPQDQPSTPHASPPHEQPTTTSKSSMSILTTLMETCATVSQKGKIVAIDVDEDITLVDVKKHEEAVTMDVKSQRRLNQEDVSAVEPTVFNDEDVTMTMAQTLIKIKAKKAKLLDE